MEEIAAQKPDLILGSFVADRSDFDRVAPIATTIGEIGDAQVDALTADLVVMLPNGGTREDLMRLPGFAALPSVGSGGMAVEDYPTVVGFNTPSSASLRYSLDRITPQLEAIGG
ncbi:hypothetical protein ACGFIU_24270 [Rhodococcus oryzae]|uniref:hypothetical protein n=1 Tax=Rhodococcus oryzae TaxID=2571143 RepID=UPI00371E6BE4